MFLQARKRLLFYCDEDDRGRESEECDREIARGEGASNALWDGGMILSWFDKEHSAIL